MLDMVISIKMKTSPAIRLQVPPLRMRPRLCEAPGDRLASNVQLRALDGNTRRLFSRHVDAVPEFLESGARRREARPPFTGLGSQQPLAFSERPELLPDHVERDDTMLLDTPTGSRSPRDRSDGHWPTRSLE